MEYALVEYPYTWLTAIFLSMPRFLAMFSVLPMFNRQALPGLLRVGVAFSMAILMVPSLSNEALSVVRDGGTLMILLLKEAGIGFLIGFIVALPLWAMDIMGAYVDNQRGASIAATINPLTGHDTSPLGEIFSLAAMTLLLISGGMFLILDIVYESYRIWPVLEMLPRFSSEMPVELLYLMDKLMRMAVLFSAPVIFVMFLAEIGLGLVSRFVPQLQVFFLAMPIKSALAMFMFSVYAAVLLGYLAKELEALPQSVLPSIRAMFL
jgi:type III secretion protein T